MRAYTYLARSLCIGIGLVSGCWVQDEYSQNFGKDSFDAGESTAPIPVDSSGKDAGPTVISDAKTQDVTAPSGRESGVAYDVWQPAVDSSLPDVSGPSPDAGGNPALCDNGAKDVGESDIDCGGACPKCAIGRTCTKASDCYADSCTGAPGTCSRGCPVGMTLAISGKTAYCIDNFEANQGEYKGFLASPPKFETLPTTCLPWKKSYAPHASSGSIEPCRENTTIPYYAPDKRGSFPVTCVDWCDATAYCRSKGKRLCGRIGGGGAFTGPSESLAPATSEWTFACENGGVTIEPYGSQYTGGTCNDLNFPTAGVAAIAGDSKSLAGCRGKGSYAPIYNMTGNVWEFTNFAGRVNGLAGTQAAMMGGSWNSPTPTTPDAPDPGAICNSLVLGNVQEVYLSVGIRCCADAK